MSTPFAGPRAGRASLVAELRERLERDTFPRGIVLAMLVAAGGVAFLASFAALRLGLDAMAVRYPLATLAGYLAFIGLVRAWIGLRRGWSPGARLGDGLDVPIEIPGLSAPARHDGSGTTWDRSGTALTDVPVEAPAGTVPAPGSGLEHAADGVIDGFAGSLEMDELWWVIVAAAALGAGLLAIGFIVYTAPVLLAEIALDSALVSTVYRRLRREEASHWATTTLRRTWVAALVLVVSMALLGLALQLLAPDARSIGGFVGHLLAS